MNLVLQRLPAKCLQVHLYPTYKPINFQVKDDYLKRELWGKFINTKLRYFVIFVIVLQILLLCFQFKLNNYQLPFLAHRLQFFDDFVMEAFSNAKDWWT